MKDFNFYAPTQVVFGRESEEKLPQLIQRYGGGKVLVHYGGGSARKSGLLDKVEKMLTEAGIPYVELGGVVPNPLLSKVREGIELCRKEHVNFILAVGGGSVIDSSKAIGYGAGYAGDVWDFWDNKAVPQACLPIGVILTIPAAGSEMSSSCVVTNDEGMLKRGFNSDLCRCKFAIMNPERTYTLPPYQTAAGAVDIMMHTLERYFIPDIKCDLTDRIAEGVLKTVRDNGRLALNDRSDYDAMAEIWWASSLSHNNLTELGRGKDFSVHKIGMALSAKYDHTHGATLSAVWASWARYLYRDAIGRFAGYARNVWGIDTADDEQAAILGINATENFFREIGMPVSLKELGLESPSDDEIRALALHATMDDTVKLSRIRPLTAADVENIYRAAL